MVLGSVFFGTIQNEIDSADHIAAADNDYVVLATGTVLKCFSFTSSSGRLNQYGNPILPSLPSSATSMDATLENGVLTVWTTHANGQLYKTTPQSSLVMSVPSLQYIQSIAATSTHLAVVGRTSSGDWKIARIQLSDNSILNESNISSGEDVRLAVRNPDECIFVYPSSNAFVYRRQFTIKVWRGSTDAIASMTLEVIDPQISLWGNFVYVGGRVVNNNNFSEVIDDSIWQLSVGTTNISSNAIYRYPTEGFGAIRVLTNIVRGGDVYTFQVSTPHQLQNRAFAQLDFVRVNSNTREYSVDGQSPSGASMLHHTETSNTEFLDGKVYVIEVVDAYNFKLWRHTTTDASGGTQFNRMDISAFNAWANDGNDAFQLMVFEKHTCRLGGKYFVQYNQTSLSTNNYRIHDVSNNTQLLNNIAMSTRPHTPRAFQLGTYLFSGGDIYADPVPSGSIFWGDNAGNIYGLQSTVTVHGPPDVVNLKSPLSHTVSDTSRFFMSNDSLVARLGTSKPPFGAGPYSLTITTTDDLGVQVVSNVLYTVHEATLGLYGSPQSIRVPRGYDWVGEEPLSLKCFSATNLEIDVDSELFGYRTETSNTGSLQSTTIFIRPLSLLSAGPYTINGTVITTENDFTFPTFTVDVWGIVNSGSFLRHGDVIRTHSLEGVSLSVSPSSRFSIDAHHRIDGPVEGGLVTIMATGTNGDVDTRQFQLLARNAPTPGVSTSPPFPSSSEADSSSSGMSLTLIFIITGVALVGSAIVVGLIIWLTSSEF